MNIVHLRLNMAILFLGKLQYCKGLKERDIWGRYLKNNGEDSFILQLVIEGFTIT